MKLAALFSDHAVLQRGISIPIWGWAKPEEEVSVSCGPAKAVGTSGPDGKFLVRLPAMKAGGPYVLEASAKSGSSVANDVWIGEVWLASGQSNMEMQVAGACQEEASDKLAESARFRMATVGRVITPCVPMADVQTSWVKASKGEIGNFSAVASFFAKKLETETGLMFGIINSSVGGTIAEAWTSRNTLFRNPAMKPFLESYENRLFAAEKKAERPTPLPRVPVNAGLKKNWASPKFNDSEWRSMTLPAQWTLQGHNHSGVFWFRKTVEVPATWAGKDLTLSIGAVDKQDITYFNGEEVGRLGKNLEEVYWNRPRVYTVPGRLVKAGTNVIAVRAYSFVYDGGLIGPSSRMHLSLQGTEEGRIPLDGAWKYGIEHNFGYITPPQVDSIYNSPHVLFDNMIAPLIPYALRGVIWYQGESNGNASKAFTGVSSYHKLFVDLIRDWRFLWGQGDFPFLFVQLASYGTNVPWEFLREAQLNALAEPNTGMAVAIDVGDTLDIHPKDKKTVGERLALWALAKVHKRHIEVSGPLYRAITIEDSSIKVEFDHVGGGLVAKNGPLKTFEIGGADGIFFPADAVIEGNSVRVSTPKCKEPVSVRYAWSSDPKGCNLYNKAGLPASPFRSDNWIR